MAELYLKTQQVADALQIGVSTVKRWIDAEKLSAVRTVGRHRLVAVSEARRFARSRNLPTTDLDLLVETLKRKTTAGVDEALRQDLLGHLKQGNASEARALILATHARVGSGARLSDELLHPVMRQIGDCWMLGTWDVYEEHQASQIVVSVLTELISSVPAPGPNAPLALGATPSGDSATIGLLSGELTLRQAGWDVRNLGPNLPLDSLAEAVKAYEPGLVFLSICYLTDPAAFLHDYLRFHEAATSVGAAVIVGGRALGHELRSQMPYTGFGDRMAHLAEFGGRLLPFGLAPLSANQINAEEPSTL